MYIMLMNFALYIIVARSDLSAMTSSLLVVLGAFGVSTITQWIVLSGYDDVPIVANLFSLTILLTVLVQLTVAIYTFYKIRHDEDSYLGYLGWSVTGFVGIFFAAPYLVTQLIAPVIL